MTIPARRTARRRRPVPLALAAAIAVSALPGTGHGQGWADVFSPDRVAESVLQSLLMTARTQADIVYGAMSVDVLGARATLTDLRVWPFLDWDEAGDCAIEVARVAVQGSPLTVTDRAKMRLAAHGVSVPAACLPPDGRAALAAVGRSEVALSYVAATLDYDVPSAGAQMTLRATAPGFAAADLAARFDYLWFEADDEMEEPQPVAFLEEASLGLEDLGGWPSVAPLLPPQLLDAGSAAFLVEGFLGSAVIGMGGGAEAGATLSEEQRRFVDSAVEAWTAFLAEPGRLELATQIPAGAPVYLDPAWNDAPAEAFAALAPVIAHGTGAAAGPVPRAALRAALEAVQGGTESGIAPDARLDVGRALVTGIGAPRDVAAGVALLEGLAGTGDADAAALLAEALETRDPEAAYGWALRAAAAGAPGAAARLDRLERQVPPVAALAAQDTLAGPLDAVAGAGRAVLSDLAQARLTGQGAVRSYRHAATLARLIGASGDPEGRALLEEIDARMAGGGSAWSAVEDEAAAAALALWLGQAQ
ncbi:hypothetical protein DLJ49_03885 [Rhodovulum sp. 12E13]|uniref:hypothetical protein n=1 Tax=Rhodovulum sp. 12E13 TaxID=2203891 RepID=UPI000E132993|nr:hypothetical protein [Rhodovulum sp. 12E13]RDC74437.1 hypothetical protein DLJ49_03885 [Rhodovulum sp. 12E13]